MARLVLVAVLASGCLISHVEGDPSALDTGEAFICEARVTCDGEEPALIREGHCGPMFDPELALAEFTASFGACATADVWCIGAGDRSVGGSGIVELCLR